MAEKVIKRRNVHPDVAQARTAVANAHLTRKSPEEIAALRVRLAEARLVAAVEKAVAQLPPLSDETCARVAALLGGAR